jgi:hypothetical protein
LANGACGARSVDVANDTADAHRRNRRPTAGVLTPPEGMDWTDVCQVSFLLKRPARIRTVDRQAKPAQVLHGAPGVHSGDGDRRQGQRRSSTGVVMALTEEQRKMLRELEAEFGERVVEKPPWLDDPEWQAMKARREVREALDKAPDRRI